MSRWARGGHPRWWSLDLERALRWAAVAHRGQSRKGPPPEVPYLEHVAGVAWIVDRAGFSERVVMAALLHDVVEDTAVTLDALAAAFGAEVAEWVDACTERKVDAEGRRRPWIDRKREALDRLAAASTEARGIALADKLHNLLSIELDRAEGRDVWGAFNADRASVLWYYRESADRLGWGDDRLGALADDCRAAIGRIDRDDPGSADRGH